MAALASWLCVLGMTAAAQTPLRFPTEDGGIIHALQYGTGSKGVVLVHGGRFNKESWDRQARELQRANFRVLSIDLRGRGQSTGPHQDDDPPYHLDVLAAVRFLRTAGARTVAVVGGSMGGSAAGDACIAGKAGEIDGVVLLGAAPDGPAEKMACRSLFIVARDDANSSGLRLPGIRAKFDRAPDPKRMLVLHGAAHAQYLFETAHADRVMAEILGFLRNSNPAEPNR